MKTKILIPLAGVILFCACKGRGGYEVVNNSSSSASDTVKADSIAGAKLVKTAGINFKTRDVRQTEQKINALTGAIAGMIIHQQITSTPDRSQEVKISADSVMRIVSLNTRAEMTVRVPSARLEAFMDSVAGMGLYVTDRSFDVTDKTLDYLSARLKLKSREELVKQQHTGKVVIKDPSKVIDLKDDVIDQQIGNRQIDSDVRNSTVNLSFYQSNSIAREVIVNDDPSNYELPFFRRMLMACENGWQLFMDMMVGLADIWFLLLCGVGLWWYIRYRKSAGARA
jgi:hypothetical protein